jgi:hypothetical protein
MKNEMFHQLFLDHFLTLFFVHLADILLNKFFNYFLLIKALYFNHFTIYHLFVFLCPPFFNFPFSFFIFIIKIYFYILTKIFNS